MVSIIRTYKLLISDVWGTIPFFPMIFIILSFLVDAHTKYIWFHSIVVKFDVLTVFYQSQVLVDRQFSNII